MSWISFVFLAIEFLLKVPAVQEWLQKILGRLQTVPARNRFRERGVIGKAMREAIQANAMANHAFVSARAVTNHQQSVLKVCWDDLCHRYPTDPGGIDKPIKPIDLEKVENDDADDDDYSEHAELKQAAAELEAARAAETRDDGDEQKPDPFTTPLVYQEGSGAPDTEPTAPAPPSDSDLAAPVTPPAT